MEDLESPQKIYGIDTNGASFFAAVVVGFDVSDFFAESSLDAVFFTSV